MAHVVGGSAASGGQLRQVRDQVVTAPLLELGGQVGGPVRAIGFQRVGEDGVGRRGPERADQRLADVFR